MVLPRPCAGCKRIVRASRCVECQRIKDRGRPSRAARGYDYQWNKLSKHMRQLQPFCSIPGCKSQDLTVDHIIPLADAPHLRLEISNLRVLCRSHNSRKGNG